MTNLSITQFVLSIILFTQVFSLPIPDKNDFCSGDNLYKYEEGKDYSYNYETETKLWINDVSDEAKSNLKLKTTVLLTPIGACTYLLRLKGSTLSGESLQDSASVVSQLDTYNLVFKLNQQGELHPEVKFQQGDKLWSRNIKRGVLSTFQAKSQSHLRSINYLSDSTERSATVYESDVLGRCRTTYSLASDSTSSSVKLNKKKSLQRCTLNGNSKTSAIQYVPYKTLPEFFQGRLFIENHECDSQIDNKVLTSVECKETSTYRVGSRGKLGAQAVVKQNLKFLKSSSSSVSAPQTDSYESLNIQFEYDNSSEDNDALSVNTNQFLANICSKALSSGLASDHSDNFRSLVKSFHTKSASHLVEQYENANSKCNLAGLTVAQAILFTDTDNSFEAVLTLLDRDVFSDYKVITEYPILTALARNQKPSESLLNKIRDYISKKSDDFAYLNKLYLVYSALVKTHCSQHECSSSELDSYTSVFTANLANNCANSQKSDLIPSSLKAIGNIGYYGNLNTIAGCATNKANSLEIRINAIQSLRRFNCDKLESLNHNYDLLQNVNEDAEVRINAFLALARCSDQSAKFNQFAQSKLAEFLLNESDVQVLTYIIDYGKEHGLTSVLNTVLNEPQIREKFSVNFKELSWNNYRYRYSVMRDSAFEVDTSVVYTSKTFIPRSVRFNVTMHMFGMSINFLDLNLRLEGLDEILKASLIDNLKSEKLLKRLMQKPEQLLDILNIVADKLKYVAEKPLISLSLRIYGSDVYYSRLDSVDELKKLAGLLKGPKENLFKQIETIRNLLLVDSKVKQPLANGLEFETGFDLSTAMLVFKSSTKEQKQDEIDFDINNFYSSSLSVHRQYDVQINTNNRLSLKKHTVLNSRLKLNVDGNRKNGSASYNLHLTPVENLPLVTMDGKFYKLTSGGKYTEVKEFKVERTNYQGCTSEKFETAFGVNLCYSVARPKASLREAFRYFRLEDVEQSVSDDDEDEEDETESGLSRPSLILSGPYSYEVVLKNPNLVKTISFDAKLTKEENKIEFNALLKTKTQSGDEKSTLQITYTRDKEITNRGYKSNMNFQFVKPETNEVRFKTQTNFEYQKGEVLAVNFVVDNKIGKEFNVVLNFGRNKTQSDAVVPNYYLDALLDSKLRDSKYYRLFAELKPNGKNIEGNLNAQKADVKLVTAVLMLKANNEENDSELDYSVDFKAESFRKGQLKVYGSVAASLLKSNIDLSADYSNPSFKLSKPANIKLSHLYDGAAGARSHVGFHLDAPMTPIDHGAKMLFTYNIESGKFEYVEVLLTKPNREKPISIFFERGSKSTDLTFGLRNAQLDLTDSTSELAKTLIRVDDQEVLKSLVIKLVRDHDKVNKKINSQLTLAKNEKTFVEIKYNMKGNLEAIRKSSSEIAKQEIGGDLYVRFMDNSGSVSAELDFESSVKNNKHEFDFEFKTENLFKMLLRISSISSEFSSNGGKFNAKVDIQKIGDVKSLKIQSTSGLRTSGSGKEFDVSFEKKLANGQVLTGTGVAKYTFKDFKNFQSEINVKDHYESKLSLETKRTNTDDLFGYHNFKFSNKHLSGFKSERDVNILVHNKTESLGNTLNLVTNWRRGDLGSLKNKEKLEILLDLNSEITMSKQDGTRKLTYTSNQIELKSKRFNIDLSKTFKIDTKTKTTRVEGSTKFIFPAIFTEPGKFRKLTHSYKYSRNTVNNELSFKNDYETDSKLFGRYFKLLNVDLNRQVLSGNNIKSSLSLDYKTANEEQLRTIRAKIDHDYVNFKANLKQNRFATFRSFIKQGQNLDVSDCTVSGKYDRKKSTANYLLDSVFNLECNGKLLTNNKVYISRSGRDSDAPITKVEFTTSSSVYYEVKSLVFQHEKFTSQNGLVGYKLQYSKDDLYSNEFSYKRTLNKNGKLESGNYTLNSQIGSYFSKKCELNINSIVDYYNSLNCRLNTTRVDNIELNYGYSLKIDNPFDYLSGKRGVQLDVVVPGRALRATYKSNYATSIDGTDDDDDENDEREFNGTAILQWNLIKEPTKQITLNIKRDNYAKGKSILFIDVVDHPSFRQLRFELDRVRTHDKTVINAATSYELKTGNKNKLDLTVKMSSDLDTNSFSFETNLQRPNLNTLYENRYNKNNGRLEYLGIRLGKLLKLSVDKESDPEQRKISLQLVNPDETKYTFDGTSRSVGSKHIVEGSLSKSGVSVSRLVSTFDSDNNNFDVQITGVSNNYRINFGLFNETLANVHILNENTNVVLGLATLQVVKHEEHNDLVLTAKWNRLWGSLQRDLLGEDAKVKENEKFNSYLGDVYGELSDDLKPVIDSFRKERQSVGSDFRNLFFILVDTYSKYLPAHLRKEDKQSELKQIFEQQIANSNNEDLPLYRRFFKAYNSLAERLQQISMKIRNYSKPLSKYVPRLPVVEYNKPQLTKEYLPFANNLVVSRPTLYARNLYQFNAEYRDYIRKFGENVLFVKRSLSRSVDGISVRALINKYKYRSLKDYTLVANVYNKRNIIGFDGEYRTLQSKCRYLLAHEMHKNRFSVVLNFNDNPYLISIYAYGQKSVDISFNKAGVDNKPVSLPHTVKLGENGVLTVTKTNVGVCAELNHDLRVCCYEDSSSCTIALTRWYTGKINGLLGQANNNPQDSIRESDWYMDKSCKLLNAQLRKPSLEAVKTCHAVFGKHRKSFFRHAIMAIRPNGWQRVCETVLTVDSKAKCLLMKAFDHHADEENVKIEAPNECFSCSANSKQFRIGQTPTSSDSPVEKGSDYVFLTLPCDKSKYGVDLSKLVSNLKGKNPLNKYYVVSVDEHDASIYLSDSNEMSNFDVGKAYKVLADDATISVSKHNFNKGLFLAASLFSKRLAQNRFLIIRSCGNCLPYSAFETLKYARKVTDRNVIVHSWGNYEMKNLEGDDEDYVPVGYDEENVYMYKPSEQTVETDSYDSYKIQHKADLCQRLAMKSHGSVVDLKQLKVNEVLTKIGEMLEEPTAKFDYKVKQCKKYDTSFGDLLDFSYTRSKIESDDN